MNTLQIVSICSILILVSSIGLFILEKKNKSIEEQVKEIKIVNHSEKIPLYYILGDTEEKIYTKNKRGEFEEIKING